MKNSEEIIEYIKTKPIGSEVEVSYKRDDKQKEATIELISHPEIEEARIGITIMTDRELITDRNVNIDTGLIGGSSAGMMFTLEIYNQLTESDITKGYYIAGTGTINSKGDVGQIGGIIHKVKAAQNAKAEMFFIPKDINEYDSNEKDAIARNNELGNPLKIIPVKNVSEVIEYLQALPPKQ
jgi:PDZ domain-containing protein